jgi:hypothetical protein
VTEEEDGCPHQPWRVRWAPPELAAWDAYWADWTPTLRDMEPCPCGQPRAEVLVQHGDGSWQGMTVLSDGSEVATCWSAPVTIMVLRSNAETRRRHGM